MTAPVDVLAVMEDAAHAIHIRDYVQERVALLDARAAVAELIEADTEMDTAKAAYAKAKTGADRNDKWARVAASESRRAAALARVKGVRS